MSCFRQFSQGPNCNGEQLVTEKASSIHRLTKRLEYLLYRYQVLSAGIAACQWHVPDIN